jgi:uncharacterized protein
MQLSKFFRHPKIIIFIISIITLFFSWFLLSISLNNDILTFIQDDHPEVLKYNETEEQFGTDRVFSIAIESIDGTIFSPEFIEIIRSLTESFSHIDKNIEVSSFANTSYIEGTSDGIEVKPMLEDYSGSADDILKLKERLLSWELYEGALYSKDLSSAQILVELKIIPTDKLRNYIYESIRNTLDNIKDPSVNWYISGLPAVTYLISNNMEADLIVLIPLVLLVVILTLYFSFRRLGGVVLPMLTIIISIIWTLGLMSIMGFSLSMLDTIIPVLLVAVGSAYGIHIISHYYDEIRKKESKPNESEHKELVLAIVKRIGKPVFLAGITTIIGFGSLISSNVVPIRNFGIFTALGVGIALIISITLIPAILLLRHNSLKSSTTNGLANSTNTYSTLYKFFHKHNIRVLFLLIIIMILGIYGTTIIDRDSVLIEYFKKDTEIRIADKFLNTKFNGSTFFEIIVEGEKPGDLTNPVILKKMDEMSDFLLSKYPEIKKIVSFTDFVKKLNQVMNYSEEKASGSDFIYNETGKENADVEFSSFFEEENAEIESRQDSLTILTESNSGTDYSDKNLLKIINTTYLKSDNLNLSVKEFIKLINIEMNFKGAGFYEIPFDPAKYPVDSSKDFKDIISQYLLLFSGNLSSLTDDDIEPKKTRMLVQLNDPGTIIASKAVKTAEEYALANFPEGYSIETTGTAKIMHILMDLVTKSQTRSILISLTLVFLILSITHRSLAGGIIGIIPIGFTVLINFGVMGIFGIRLDISTAMVAAVSIGIGIDYTIHYLSYYHFERLKTDDLEIVAQKTLSGAGKAIILNAVSVGAGFLILLFSRFNPLNYFGILIAITMIISSTASLTLLPILLEIFKPKFISRK